MVGVTQETEAATCLECDERFERVVVVVDGRRLGPKVCERCHEASEERMEASRPERKVDVMEELHRIGVNVRKHGRCRIESWDGKLGSAPADAARGFVREVIEAGRWTEVRGLYLCGDTGTGKTHLAVGILRELVEADVRGAMIFDRADRLITEIQDTYGTGGTGQVIGRRETALVWVLDDLGAEKATPDVLRILTDLMSAREGHPTVITSNLDPHALTQRWSGNGWARLASRLASQNFRALRVRGEDRRFAA